MKNNRTRWAAAALILALIMTGCTFSWGRHSDSDGTAGTPGPVTGVTPQTVQTPSSPGLFVYLVAPEGSTGPLGPFGCGNYLVPVVRGEYPPTTSDRQIAYALMALFSIKDQFYGQSGLMNTLYQSNLTVQSVTVDATGHATVKLSGDYLLSGVCSDPLFRAQIEQTALQFSINGVSVFINDKPLEDIVSGRGN